MCLFIFFYAHLWTRQMKFHCFLQGTVKFFSDSDSDCDTVIQIAPPHVATWGSGLHPKPFSLLSLVFTPGMWLAGLSN